MSHRHKLLVAMALIIVILLSSGILGAALYDKEISTGGMDLKWKLDLTEDEKVFGQLYGTFVIQNENARLMKFIDLNGKMIGSFSYTGLNGNFICDNGHLCYIDQHDGTKTVLCRGANGSLEWSFSDPLLYGVDQGSDGRFYLRLFDPDASKDTIVCIGPNGSEIWRSTEDSSLGVWGICEDGTALLLNVVFTPNGTSVIDFNVTEQLISVSADGAVIGRLNLPSSLFGMLSYREQLNNGTIVVSQDSLDFTNLSYMGMTKDLQQCWPLGSTYYIEKGQEEGPMTFKFNNVVEVDGDGVSQVRSTMYAYNTSDGTLLFKIKFNGTVTGMVYVNNETAFVDIDHDTIWAVGPTGRAYCVNNTSRWGMVGGYGNGLLLGNDGGLRLIDNHGSTIWRYILEGGSISNIHLTMGDTILLQTSDGISAIHKPQISNTMVYFVALISVDMLILLSSGVWMMDHRLPEERDR